MKPEISGQDELQRMLARKRQEPPPQKILKHLSSAVIDRIQHPDPLPPPTAWQRLGLDFDRKPVLVCVSGVAVCGLLAYALISSRHVQAPPLKSDVDPAAASLAIQPTPGQIGSAPPLKAPGAKPDDLPRDGDPLRVSPDPGHPMEMRAWPAPSAPAPGGK